MQGVGLGDFVPDVHGVMVCGRGQIVEDLVLRIQPDRFADQFAEVDPMGLSVETQIDAVVPVSFGQHP